ncbi:uncharacterized protein fip1l1a isoform X2 [Oryzias latipes]
MSSSADSTEAFDEDEEGKLYQLIYELKEEKGETERTPMPPSPKHSRVHLEIHAERRTNIAEAPKLCPLKKVQGIKKSVQTKESLQKKPWNEPNANVSDYFNYGFTEETWKAYCKKQTKLQAFKRSQKIKNTAQRTCGGVKAGASVPAENFFSGKPSPAASRKSKASAGVTKGFAGSRSRGKSSPCYQANKAQDVIDSSHKENIFPVLDQRRKAKTSILFPFVPPRSFLFQPRSASGYGSSFCMSALSMCAENGWVNGGSMDRHHTVPSSTSPTRQADGSDMSFKPLFHCSLGNNMLSSGLTETTKAWNRHIRQRKHHRDRDGSREHDLDKESMRERNREKQTSSSRHRRSSTTHSHKYSRVKEQTKARSSKDESHRCCSFKDIMGENRRKDRSWKPDRVSHSSTQGSCSRKFEDRTMVKDAKRRKNKT